MNPVGIHEPLDTASDYKLSENGSSREIDTQGAWLAIMQSCSAALRPGQGKVTALKSELQLHLACYKDSC